MIREYLKIGGSAGNLADGEELCQLGQDDDIVMTAEHVLITMYDDYYTVDAKFRLKNEGGEKQFTSVFRKGPASWKIFAPM